MKLWDAERRHEALGRRARHHAAALSVTRTGGVMKLWDAEHGTTRPR